MSALADAGLRAVAAGPDVALDDEAGYKAFAAPDAEAVLDDIGHRRVRAWRASRATVDAIPRRPAAPVWARGFSDEGWLSMIGISVHLDDEVPEGFLRPTFIERTDEP